MTETPGDAATDRQRLIILIGSVTLLLISAGGMYLIVVALKDVAMEFGWPRAVPSFAFSLQFIGSGFGGIIMGYCECGGMASDSHSSARDLRGCFKRVETT